MTSFPFLFFVSVFTKTLDMQNQKHINKGKILILRKRYFTFAKGNRSKYISISYHTMNLEMYFYIMSYDCVKIYSFY